MAVTNSPQPRRSRDTNDPYRTGMAALGTWLVRLGNAGAARNAATMVAQRRAAEARANAVMRRFAETAPAAISRRIPAA